MSEPGDRDEWKRQLGTLWRVASSGIDTLRDVVVRSSQEGRLRVDLAVYQRERRDLFEEIGRAVVQLADAGRIELPESLSLTLVRLRQVDERIAMDGARMSDNAFGAPRGYEPEAGDYGSDDDSDSVAADDSRPDARKRP
ncbi:MAG: hypothetical protein ABI321_19910 [Polyangia bacterium]